MKSNLILIIILAFFVYDFLNKKQNKDSTRIKTITPEKNKRIKENFSDTYDKYISKKLILLNFYMIIIYLLHMVKNGKIPIVII